MANGQITDDEVTRVHGEPPHAPAVEAGAGLGNYRLGDCIGAGLLSEVFDGFNQLAQKPCAIKIFRREANISPAAYGRFVHEAGLLARIGHAGLADVYLCGKTDSRFFTVMERVRGTALRTLLAKHTPLSRRIYLPVVRGLCNALAALHAHDLAHRHLHAGQVMVVGKEPTLEIKLLDCGTHHLLPGLQDQPAGWHWRPEDAVCVAPEQVKGQSGDSRSDVYALAVLLYEMVTGRVPFLASSFAATLELHVNEPPRRPSELVELPPELGELILRGLEKDPRKRIPSVEALLAGLDPLSITGQFQLLGASRKSTGRQKVLTAVSSQELQLADASALLPDEWPAEEARSKSEPPRLQPVPSVRVRGSRRWLFALLGGVTLGCGLAIALLLIEKEPTPAGTSAAKSSVPVLSPSRPPGGAVPGPPPSRPPATTGFGFLEVRTDNPAARVFVDGNERGRGVQVLVPQLPAGSHRVQVEVDGKASAPRDIQLSPNERLRVVF